MRFRLLLTDGKRTTDVIWATHTGQDLYYGFVGADFKESYHASGVRHMKSATGEVSTAERNLRLDAFKQQLQLCAFGVQTDLSLYPVAREYQGKTGDSIVYLDTRTLPEFLSVSFGLVECNNLGAMLPIAPHHDVRLTHIVTSTIPWIYVTIHAITPEVRRHWELGLARELRSTEA